MQIEVKKIADLKPAPYNPRKSNPEQEKHLQASLSKFGVVEPVIWNKQTGYIVGGHFRVRELKKLGYKEVECVIVDLSPEDEKELNIRLNANTGEFDWDELEKWDNEELKGWGLVTKFESDEEKENEKKQGSLQDRFLIPPFSVLDTRQAIWQDRKRWWLNKGIKSELGRDSKSIKFSKKAEELSWAGQKTGISIFDPVLCELSYRWFNIPNGKILDPFAGGSVRGIVAAELGYEYLGNDLRVEQIEANRINAKEVLQDAEIYPTWTCGDSLEIDKITKGYKADMIFSCPPYADLEVYSDDPKDISNMSYQDFLNIYKEIIRKSCEMLNQDSFAVFVVGDVRDKKGFYQNFVSDTIMAFGNCGVILYNEMILVNAVGAKAIGANGYMKSRKVGKVHQNVLVFYKGNPKNIKQKFGELDLSYVQNELTDDVD